MVLMMDVVTAAQLISLNIKLDMYVFIGLTKYLKKKELLSVQWGFNECC